MNGSQIKQAAIQKAKQVANVSNGNANKKRKKELKPIITTDGPQDKSQSQSQDKDAEAASNIASSNQPSAG
jgi:serine/threonine-protein kinase SRPK3